LTDYELNREVALEVFGYYPEHLPGHDPVYPNRGVALEDWAGDIRAAWKVVERLRELGLVIITIAPSPGNSYWEVLETTLNSFIFARDPEVCRAICLAALKAVRQQKEATEHE